MIEIVRFDICNEPECEKYLQVIARIDGRQFGFQYKKLDADEVELLKYLADNIKYYDSLTKNIPISELSRDLAKEIDELKIKVIELEKKVVK